MPKPNQVPKLNHFEGVDPVFQQHYSQLIDTVNTLAGYNGSIELSDHIDMGGRRIMGVGAPVDPTDAISTHVATSKFSASALAPQIAPGTPNAIVGYRQIGSGTQREPLSSYLNDLMSSVPNANQIFPVMTTVGGGVQVTVNASLFTFADGSTVHLQGRTDLLSFPATFPISSISSVGNLVTVVTTVPSGITAGQTPYIFGVTPLSFDGLAVVTSATPPFTFTYQSSLGTLSGTGGSVQLGGTYYYAVKKRSSHIFIFGPFPFDSPSNRIQTNFDGAQIVCVVVITASGGQIGQSGGGGTATTGSPAGGSFF